MADKKPKNILMVNGVLHGHFTGTVEIARELVSLGHNVTCLVLDEFENRIKDVGAKIVAFSVDISKFNIPPDAPPIAIQAFNFAGCLDAILTFLLKEETKYDYYIFDSFFEIQELNKLLKIPIEKIVLIYTSFVLTDEDTSDLDPPISITLKPLNMKYNLNLHNYVSNHYVPNKFKKLILTSKYFHLRSDTLDETCFFIGPCIEKRKIDKDFNFKKDKNKKLILISLGTIFNIDSGFYSTCIEAFKNSEEYQVIISVGIKVDIKQYWEIPKNISIFNYIPQIQVLLEVDIFITHGGLNSTQEGLISGTPLIAIPQRYDQFDNGRRIKQLGAGILLDKNKINVDVLKNAVNDVVSNMEKYKKGVAKIVESFKEVQNNRKSIYQKIFV